jgi:hypothetical protein
MTSTIALLAAPGMVMALQDSGWQHFRVVPYCDLERVQAAWIFEVREALGRT